MIKELVDLWMALIRCRSKEPWTANSWYRMNWIICKHWLEVIGCLLYHVEHIYLLKYAKPARWTIRVHGFENDDQHDHSKHIYIMSFVSSIKSSLNIYVLFDYAFRAMKHSCVMLICMNYYLNGDEILVLYLLYLHPSLGVQQLCKFTYIF